MLFVVYPAQLRLLSKAQARRENHHPKNLFLRSNRIARTKKLRHYGVAAVPEPGSQVM